MLAIFISSVFLAFFIVVLLLTKKQKGVTDKILAFLMGVIGLQMLGYYLKQTGYWELYPHLIGTTAPVLLFHGPLLYLYCLYSLRPDTQIRKIDFLHFIPGIGGYLYMTRFFFLYSAEQKRLVDSGAIDDYDTFAIILLFSIFISGITYAVLSYRLTILHKRKMENQFSFTENINLKWVRYIILSMGLIFVTAAIVMFVRDYLKVAFPFNADYIFYTIIILFIFFVGFYGIKQQNLFVNQTKPTPKPENEPVAEPEVPKYKHSGISDEEAKQLYTLLLQLMEQEKPFLESKLTLSELAEMMKITPNQLSQVINQVAKINFYDFINQYRVEAFIKQAEENPQYNLLSVALDAGFNSKSSFNQIFKKYKGVTPSTFLAQKRPKL
ncbi:MAG: hypothetical protein H6Q25_987 [Bacteroidetes bacterium]|nr:hypothetical protein [Bacteroidota bacterium]